MRKEEGEVDHSHNLASGVLVRKDLDRLGLVLGDKQDPAVETAVEDQESTLGFVLVVHGHKG